MLAVRVEIDDKALRAILDAIQPPAINDVAARALNQTARDAEDEAVRILAPMMGLPAEAIDTAFQVTPATAGRLQASLVAAGKAIKMIEFHPRGSRQEGVVLHMAGKDEHYTHAFIVTVRHGHTGVFERKGHARLPIRELYGPSVPGMLARSDVLPKVVEAVEAALPTELATAIANQAKRAASSA
jgi:hypothetical protein